MALFILRGIFMNLYIYSDESGVFDNKHEKYFVFGGLIFFSKLDRDDASRKYSSIEKQMRKKLDTDKELKANFLTKNDKRRLFSSIHDYFKFGIIIRLNSVIDEIFIDKKSKQRYLDYAYKIGVKNALLNLSANNKINLNEIKNMYFYCDEHTTATNGKYELREALEQEFKRGTFNSSYQVYFAPITPKLCSVNLKYCNSDKVILIRAADIIANKLYNYAKQVKLKYITNIYLHILP